MLRGFLRKITALLLLSAAACSSLSPLSRSNPNGNQVERATFTPSSESSQSPSPTAFETEVFPQSETPPPLPGPFEAAVLNPLDSPHTYINDQCQYLRDKWSSTNSPPGTVVMVIMFHRITNGALTDPSQISEYDFRQLMNRLHTDGFQAINIHQLDGFLEHNARIPSLSVLLVTDDKHPAAYFDGLFRQYWTDYGWPVVNAWISDNLTTDELWQQEETLNSEGWVDFQAHGVISIPITNVTSEETILSELNGSITAIQSHFNKIPLAYIWPGGGFTPRAATLARRAGYRLGFTTNPRGPLMYDWVPLADAGDPKRPTWIPEGRANNPLMVLPRYWDTDASLHLNEVIQIGHDAASYALGNKNIEIQYYDNFCSAAYGAIA